jgi:hypothetical protein
MSKDVIKKGILPVYGDRFRYSRNSLPPNSVTLWPGQWHELTLPILVYKGIAGEYLDEHPAAGYFKTLLEIPGLELWQVEYVPWPEPLPLYKGEPVSEWAGAEVKDGEIVVTDPNNFYVRYAEWCLYAEPAVKVRLVERYDIEYVDEE